MTAAGSGVGYRALREVVQTLAAVERPPCSAGEREAAEWLATRLEQAGCEVQLEQESAHDGYLQTAAALGLLAAGGTLLVMRGRPILGSSTVLAAAAGLIDDVQNGPRVIRRLLRSRRTTVNVVAQCGDPEGSQTLVVIAHHDAHQSGRFYDQRLQLALYRLAPKLIDRARTSPPQWWLGLAGPLLTLLGAGTGRRGTLRAALVLTLASVAIVAEIASNPTVPGANDNLSGVAGLVALAELLREQPQRGVRWLLVSCGAEEALQEGARGFVARHQKQLDPAHTQVLNLETVGSPRLIMLEGEGPFWMEDYTDASFRDLIADAAQEAGILLERGFRARASTDSIIHSRAGYPTATLSSLTHFGTLANYHLRTDTPENVEYETIAAAVQLSYAVGRALATEEQAHVGAATTAI
jgi:Peptidase family M28